MSKSLRYGSVVMPNRPVFDKIAALHIVMASQGAPLGFANMDVEFRKDSHFQAQTWRRWQEEGVAVIDVGPQKYQLQDKGSACSVIAAQEGVTDPVLLELAEIADKNNGTGFLKAGVHRVAWILREMYKIGNPDNVVTPAPDVPLRISADLRELLDALPDAEAPKGNGSPLPVYSRMEIVCRVAEVIHRWVQQRRNGSRWPERTEEAFVAEPKFTELLSRLGITDEAVEALEKRLESQKLELQQQLTQPDADQDKLQEQLEAVEAALQNPSLHLADDLNIFSMFSVGGYALNLWQAGFSEEKVIDRAGYFLDAEDLARDQIRALGIVWEEVQKTATEFPPPPKVLTADKPHRPARGVLIRCNNENLVRWLLKRKPYQVIVNRLDKNDPRRRNVGIFTRGKKEQLDLTVMAEILELLEGNAQKDGKWYFDPRLNALLNGTPGFRSPATFLRNGQILKLIELLVLKTYRLWDERLTQFVDDMVTIQPANRQGSIDRARILDLIDKNQRPQRQPKPEVKAE